MSLYVEKYILLNVLGNTGVVILHMICTCMSWLCQELEGQWQSANSHQEQLEAAEWDLKNRLGQVQCTSCPHIKDEQLGLVEHSSGKCMCLV